MKRLAFLLLGGLGFAFAKTWTVMVFLNGDNNLEGAGIDDINEMEAAVDTSLYDVFVLFDRISGYDNSNGNWTDTRLFRVLPDNDPDVINSELIKDCGELNMGDPATIVWFVDTVAQMTNSDYYFLILWNHGSGWDKGGGIKGVSYDDTDGDNISVAGGLSNGTISNLYDNAQRYYDSDFMDIYDFADAVANSSGLPSELRAAAQRLVDLQGDGSSWVDTALIGSFFYEEDDWGTVSGSHGISVYAPTGSPSGAYSGLYWSTNSAWYWFIQGETSLPSEPLLTYEANSLGDSIPKGRVAMKVLLRNSGGSDASSVTGRVYTQDPYVTVLAGDLTFGTVASEGTAESAESLVVQVDTNIPPGHRVSFFMDVSASGGYTNTTSWNMIASDRFVPVAEAPRREPVLLVSNLGPRSLEVIADPQGRARLAAYDPSGRLVKVLWEGEAHGVMRLTWTPPRPGAYFVRLEGRRNITRKAVAF